MLPKIMLLSMQLKPHITIEDTPEPKTNTERKNFITSLNIITFACKA